MGNCASMKLLMEVKMRTCVRFLQTHCHVSFEGELNLSEVVSITLVSPNISSTTNLWFTLPGSHVMETK